MFTCKEYEKYLNELGKSFSEEEFIIGGRKRNGKYGTMLRRHDRIAFRAGYREWKEKQIEDLLKQDSVLFEKVYDRITDACDALTEFRMQMQSSDFVSSRRRIRMLAKTMERLKDLAHETEEFFAWN